MATEETESPDAAEESFPLRVGSEAGERLLGWLLLGGGAILALLSLAPNAVTRFHTWPWYLYWQVFLVLPPAAFLVGAAARRPMPRLGAALDLGLVLWAAGAVIGAWLSPYRETSLAAALLPLAGISLAYVLRGWMGYDPVVSRRRAGQAFRVVAALAAVFVAISWVYWFVFDVGPARDQGVGWLELRHLRNIHPLGHSIYTAGFVVLTLPLLAVQAWQARGLPRIAWALAVVAALGLLLLSSSRGGVLGIAAMLAAAVLVALWAGRLPRRTKLLILGGGLLLVAGLVALNPRLRELVVHRGWSAASSASNQERLAMMHAGWLMGSERPLRGWGPGTVSLVYPRFRARLAGGNENVLELHSTPVQMWAELGVLGVAAMLALATGVVMRAWRLRPGAVVVRAGSREDLVRAWALVFALGGYGVFALTDHQLDVPWFVAVLAGIVAVLSALTRSPGLAQVAWSPTFVRAVPAALMAGAVVVIVSHVIPDLRARQAFVHGVIALEEGDGAAFHARVARARQLAPWEPFYPNQLAVQLLVEMDAAPDEARQAVLRAQAVTALQESLALAPAQEFCHTNLGWLLLDSGRPAEAEEHFRAAAHLVPDKGGVYWGLAVALVQQGREDAGRHAFALEWINDPRAITHPVWQRPDWAERRAAVQARAQAMLAGIGAGRVAPEVTARAAYVHALIAWWFAPDAATAARARNVAVTDEQREFFRAMVRESEDGEDAAAASAPWQVVRRAWSAEQPADVLAELPPNWTQWEPALAARINRQRESFAAFLTGPGADADRLVWRDRPERTAFGMHARNSDGQRVVDRTIREHNVLVDLLPGTLFPPKGWLPGPAMVRLLASPLPD